MSLLDFACDNRKEWEMKGHGIVKRFKVESSLSSPGKTKAKIVLSLKIDGLKKEISIL
jgi:hypothetical protein